MLVTGIVGLDSKVIPTKPKTPFVMPDIAGSTNNLRAYGSAVLFGFLFSLESTCLSCLGVQTSYQDSRRDDFCV